MDLINSYSNVGNDDIDNMQETLDAQRRGYHAVMLTEMDSTSIPEIAAGSIVEVAGALYEAGTDEEIDGSASAGTNYIKLVPDTDIVTPTWTDTAPTWSDEKQGWYGTGASASHRYIEFSVIYDDPNYIKFICKFYKTKILAYLSAPVYNTAEINPVIFDVEVFDVNGEYNTTTGITTLIQSGFYLIFLSTSIVNQDANAIAYVELYKNGASYIRGDYFSVNGSTTSTYSPSLILYDYFKSGDQLKIYVNTGSANGDLMSTSDMRTRLNIVRYD